MNSLKVPFHLQTTIAEHLTLHAVWTTFRADLNRANIVSPLACIVNKMVVKDRAQWRKVWVEPVCIP